MSRELHIHVRPAHDAAFEEAKHPRSKTGEFAKTAGGGAPAGKAVPAQAKPGEYVVGHGVNKLLKTYGFTKHKYLTKENGGIPTFVGPNGVRVSIHPPEPGKTSSNKWHIAENGKPGQQGTGIALEKLLQKVVAQGALAASGVKSKETPLASPQEQNTIISFSSVLGPKGYEYMGKESQVGAQLYKFKKGDATINVTKKDDVTTWISSSPGNVPKTGQGSPSLAMLLSGKKPPNPPWSNVGSVPTPKVTANTNTPAPVAPKPPPPKPEDPEHVALRNKLAKDRPIPTPEEEGAIGSYTGSGYMALNDCLRHQDDCGDPRTPKIEGYLKRANLKEAVTVYRGISGDYAKILKSLVTVGTKFVDRGFMSTSTNAQFSKNWGGNELFMKIELPPGTQAAPVALGSSEYEVLVQRGSTMVVKSYDRATKTMHVTVEPHHKPAEAAAA